MSFRFRFNQDSQGEDLPAAGMSFSQNLQPHQEMMMPPLVSHSQSQRFMYDLQPQPRQVQSYAARIRNLQLPPTNQRRYGGGGGPSRLRQPR